MTGGEFMKQKKGLGIHSFLTEQLLICIVPIILLVIILNVVASSNLKSGLQREAHEYFASNSYSC